MFENLKKFLVDELHVKAEDVTMESELAGDLGINSLELADLVYLCEEKFNVVIDDEDLHNFITVGDVVRYLETAQNWLYILKGLLKRATLLNAKSLI